MNLTNFFSHFPHRSLPTLALLVAGLSACGGTKDNVWNKGDVPIGTVKKMEQPDGGVATEAGDSADACRVQEASVTEVEAILAKPACATDAALDVGLGGRLAVSVSPTVTSIVPGGHVDFAITLENLTKGELPLYFRLNPGLETTVSAFDKNGKQADKPTGTPPHRAPPPVRTARVILRPGAKIHLAAGWDAVARKWGNDAGIERAMAGADLKKGKYTLRVFLPLIGVVEGENREVTTAKIPITIEPAESP
jgi:hypothetical protein